MPLTIEAVLADLDIPAVKSCVRGTFMGKYGVSLRHGAGEAIEWARAFKLDAMPPCRVLDIGCGSSIFARVCNKLGHDATGIDQPGYMHAELARLMGVRFVEHKVTAANPLPDFFPATFDVVTMMHVSNHEGAAFYQSLAGEVWDALTPGGIWWVVFHIATQSWARCPHWSQWFAGTVTQAGSRVLRLEKPK